jgi:adenylosuccinate synthase
MTNEFMDILLGLQWGDEGKGKVVDFLAHQYDMVARFQGGPNAGHTLLINGYKHILRQIPSGVFRSEVCNLIGNGVVLDLVTLKQEIENLQKIGVDLRSNLLISKKTQLILPTHRLLDAAYEQAKGERKIGSTLKGIGPAYQDKIGRSGLRIGDLLENNFMERYAELKELHFQKLRQLNFPTDLGTYETEFLEAVEYIRQFQLIDSEYYINQSIQKGKKILAEGAQGTMLDIDFGTYPFVTSSNTSAAGACTGLGIAPNKIGEVFGIFKAYCTRVGSGPFPSELFDEDGENIRKIGHEFGSVTGRPRRCGWLDLVALKYAVMIDGVTQLFMMKADILNHFEQIKIATQYLLPNGQTTDQLPFDTKMEEVKPVYQTFEGWNCELKGISTYEALPAAFRNYVAFIENFLGVPVSLISYGAERDETILRENFLSNK